MNAQIDADKECQKCGDNVEKGLSDMDESICDSCLRGALSEALNRA